MKTRLEAGGAVAGTAQPAPSRALSHGASAKRLPSWFRSARVIGMKTRPEAGGIIAGTAQPAPSCTLLPVASGKCLTNWFRSARMTDMNRPADMHDMQTTGGGSC